MGQRRFFVAGNWKMNTLSASGVALAKAIADDLLKHTPAVDVAVCPPAVYLSAVKATAAGSPLMVGGQNCSDKAPGAFTGELTAEMLLDVGCQWVILGHSERRQFYGETDAIVNSKLKAAQAKGLGVMFCLGELLAERQGNLTEQVLETQLAGGLADLTAEAAAKLVVAYEPVWAIGTGLTATPDQAEAAHRFIRRWLAGKFGSPVAEQIRIQYGGSVKAENAAELLAQPNVDGALVGGASLKAEQFLPIIHAAAAITK